MMPRIMHWNIMFRMALIFATALATRQTAEIPPHHTEIARLLALGGDGFRVHHTVHFLIASDSDESVVHPLADRLEVTYQAVMRFCDDIQLLTHPPPQLLPVLLFNRYSDYERYAGKVGFRDPATPGFYHSPSNTVAICNLLDLPKLREISKRIEQAEAQPDSAVPRERITEWRSRRDAIAETFNRLVIQHEAAHQIQFNVGVLSRSADNPDWLVEGLACQFEVPPPDAVNQLRLADFREALGVKPDAVNIEEADLRAAWSNGRFISLVDLVAGGDFNDLDVDKRTGRYAQAWALVNYLHRHRGDAFARYMRRIAVRPPNERTNQQQRIADFEAEFGLPDDTFERDWLNSIFKLPFDPHHVGR